MLEIIEVNRNDNELLLQAEGLWEAFYGSMAGQGLMIPLAQGGTTEWRRSIEGALGRTMHLVLAMNEARAVGMALGSLRLLPAYLGGKLCGYVNGLYVDPGFRGSGLGRELNAALDEWFASRNVTSVELQVLSGNIAARQFWQKMGYQDELLQMRRMEEGKK